MNIRMLFISLFLTVFSIFSNRAEPILMIPGNLLQIGTATFYDQKLKKWELQPNDHLKLVKYEIVYNCGRPDQQWLFQAVKPGQTKLVFKRKKKITEFPIHILKSNRPPNLIPQKAWFQSNQ